MSDTVNVVSVTYHEGGRRTVSFECPGCGALHEDYGWPVGVLKAGNVLGFVRCQSSCGTGFDVVIPDWCFDARHRTGYAKFQQRPHSVFSDEAAGSPVSELQRDDSATEAHNEHNWIE